MESATWLPITWCMIWRGWFGYCMVRYYHTVEFENDQSILVIGIRITHEPWAHLSCQSFSKVGTPMSGRTQRRTKWKVSLRLNVLTYQEIASVWWVERWHPHMEAFCLKIKGKEAVKSVLRWVGSLWTRAVFPEMDSVEFLSHVDKVSRVK